MLRGQHAMNTYAVFLNKESCCYCSVVQSCQTLCDPMDCSTPGFPILHYLPEFAQIYVLFFKNYKYTLIYSECIFVLKKKDP